MYFYPVLLFCRLGIMNLCYKYLHWQFLGKLGHRRNSFFGAEAYSGRGRNLPWVHLDTIWSIKDTCFTLMFILSAFMSLQLLLHYLQLVKQTVVSHSSGLQAVRCNANLPLFIATLACPRIPRVICAVSFMSLAHSLDMTANETCRWTSWLWSMMK